VAVPAFGAREVELMRAGATNRDNLAVEFRTVIEPDDEGLTFQSWRGGVRVTTDGVFHRFIADQANRMYAGYDVRLQEIPDKQLLMLKIEPFSLDPSELPFENAENWKFMPVVREPQTKVVGPEESVALDLLVYTPPSRTVVEYITVGRDLERLRRPRQDRSEPRPFKAEDTEMELNTPKILINGEPFKETSGTLSVSGSTLGLYIKSRGRFLFSMFPHEELGFQRAGWVSRTVLHFELAGDTFEIESRRRIVPGAGKYYVYVLHEPGYRPDGVMATQDVFVFAAGPPASALQIREP
jgi:hypothetical protein